MSEVRQRLNVISRLEGEEFTDEIRSEADSLGNEYRDLETRFRSAVISEAGELSPVDKEDAEGREVRGLIRKASLSEFLRESITQSPLSGSSPEVELRSAMLGESAQPGSMPWAVLAGPDALERRADAETTLSDSVSKPNRQRAILARVFAQSATQFIGVDMPSVPVGTASWPILTAGTTASMKEAGASVDAGAATFSTETLSPTRLTARYLFRVEDLSLLEGMESALRNDLSSAMSDQMDVQSLTGNGTAPNVNGLLSKLTAPAKPPAVFTWADAVGAITGSVDGKYASMSNQIKMLSPADLYGKLGTTLHATAPVGTAGSHIGSISGGLRVSANLPQAPSNGGNANISTALLSKTGNVGAVAPVWEGLSVIRDPYTGAASGQVALTAVSLWSFKVIRSAVFSLKKFKLA